MRPLIAICLLTTIAACQAEKAPDAAPTPSPAAATASPMVTPVAAKGDEEDACGAGKLGRWLNALPADDVKAAIAATVGERPTRYIGPNDAVTMDFHADRLNVELGDDGRIKRFHCG